jgi:hypothetical protein
MGDASPSCGVPTEQILEKRGVGERSELREQATVRATKKNIIKTLKRESKLASGDELDELWERSDSE